MKILFELNHPGHFHLFKYVINNLIDTGHDVLVLSKSDITLLNLLDQMPHWKVIFQGKKGSNFLHKLLKQFAFTYQAIKLINKNKIDICAGVSVTLPQASFITRTKSILLDDDDKSVTRLFALLSHPFANRIISPASLRTKRDSEKYIFYQGQHELAYLHPDNFYPNNNILEEIGLGSSKRLIFVRFNAFRAHHDIGENGLSRDQRRKLISILHMHGQVFISTEADFEPEFEPFRLKAHPGQFHHIMSKASLYVGESQTMSSEAAILGVPSVRINTFKGRLSVLNELEDNYALLFSFLPSEFDLAIKKIKELLKPGIKEQWAEKRKMFLRKKINVSDFITSEILKFENS